MCSVIGRSPNEVPRYWTKMARCSADWRTELRSLEPILDGSLGSCQGRREAALFALLSFSLRSSEQSVLLKSIFKMPSGLPFVWQQLSSKRKSLVTAE